MKFTCTSCAMLVHADVSFETEAEFRALVPIFRRHAALAGVPDELAALDTERIPTMPIIGTARTLELLTEAGFGTAREIFRGLWYRGWVCTAEGETASPPPSRRW